jgi:hypothetical protein
MTVTHQEQPTLSSNSSDWDAHFRTARDLACQKPDLISALTFIVGWEADRALRQAIRNHETGNRDADGKKWDTCFRFCIEGVLAKWARDRRSNR